MENKISKMLNDKNRLVLSLVIDRKGKEFETTVISDAEKTKAFGLSDTLFHDIGVMLDIMIKASDYYKGLEK